VRRGRPTLASAIELAKKLTPRQREFVEMLAKDPKHNQTGAARACGYKDPTKQGSRLMRTPRLRAYYTALMQAAIDLGKPGVLTSPEGLAEVASISPYSAAGQMLGAVMERVEVLKRLSDHASANMLDFVSYAPVTTADGQPMLDREGRPIHRPFVDMAKIERLGKGHLIKKLKEGQYGTEIELVDSQGALKILYGDDAPIGAGSRERSWREALRAMPPQFVLALHDKMLQGSAIPTTARVVGGNGGGGNGHA
jgi:hypothetical protein